MACGNCLPGCDSAGVGAEPFPFPEDDPSGDIAGVALDVNGDLILDSESFENHFIWIANEPEGTVLKIDTRTGRQVGRYASVSHQVLVDTTGDRGRVIEPWNQGRRNSPSRTAIDFNFDAWVANRGYEGSTADFQPSVTKIRNDVADCVDRNRNHAIDTSRGQWRRDPIDDPAGFSANPDECIQFTSSSARGAGARARDRCRDRAGDQATSGSECTTRSVLRDRQAQQALLRRVPATGSLGSRRTARSTAGRLWPATAAATAMPG